MMLERQWAERLVRYQYLEPLVSGRRVLEVGCGLGRGADFLAGRAAHVVAIEPVGDALGRARERFQRANLAFVPGDPAHLRQPDQSFDVVLVPELQRWIAHGRLIPELRRVLRPDGVAAFIVPSADAGRSPGLSYQDLVEYVAQGFEQVRIFGEIPFTGRVMADFSPVGEVEASLDCSLIEEDELPSHYLAMGGESAIEPLPYTVVQLPLAGWEDEPDWLRTQLDRTRQERDRAYAQLDAARHDAPPPRAVVEPQRVWSHPPAIADESALLASWRARAEAAENLRDQLNASVELLQQRAERAERRCDALVNNIEQSAAELARLHQRVAELQGLRQTEQWHVDELEGRLRVAEAKALDAGRGQPVQAAGPAGAAHEQADAPFAGRADPADVSDEQPSVAVLEQRIEVLLKGAVLHEQVAAEWRARNEETTRTVERLRRDRDDAHQRLTLCENRTHQERERAERYRRDLVDVGRRLARAEGELRRLDQTDNTA